MNSTNEGEIIVKIRKNRSGFSQAACVTVAVCVASVLVACQTTRQTRNVQAAGFLGDYSQLRKGEGKEAQLIYINSNANWQSYNAIMIDSVTIWYNDATEKMSAEDRKALTDLLYADLHTALGQDYAIVDHPGPRTLRLRAAITEAKGAKVVGNTITTIVPQARMLSTLTGLATNTQVFVGKAAIEAELTDSMSGERLIAAVDERAGAKTLRGIGGKWKDVDNAFKYWSEQIQKRLAELRAG
jgi:hypothetical protein